jgi:hypothetical protein
VGEKIFIIDMNIIQIEEKDVPAIALVHKKSFDKTHFTAFFSPELLKRYIKTQIDYNSHSYLVEEGGRILRYLIGVNRKEAVLNNFSKNNYF